MKAKERERRFDRGAPLHLLMMAFLLLLAVASTVYRLALPTDGWLAHEPEDFDTVGFIYQVNVMDVPSGLLPGDHLVAVEGLPLEGGISPFWPLRSEWQAGNTVRYTILRGEQEVEVDVPLTKWTVAQFYKGGGISTSELVGYLGSVVFLVMGFLTIWRRPDIPAARALWVLSGVIFSIFTAIGLLPIMIPDSVYPFATISVEAMTSLAFTVLLPPAFIRFALVFPKPVPALQRRPWMASLPYLVGVIGLGAFLVDFYVFGGAWTALSVFIALAILVHNAITMREAVSRAQMFWGSGGLIIGLGLFSSNFIGVFIDLPEGLVTFLDTISTFGFGIMGIALGIAILRYRLFDINVIIRKTLVYSTLTALLGLVYFGSVVSLQTLFEAVTGERSPIAIVISTLLIAALFGAVRRRVQAGIDRRFFRQKYDGAQALAAFSQTARDEVDLEVLTAELLHVVETTIQPEKVSLWLKPGAIRQPNQASQNKG